MSFKSTTAIALIASLTVGLSSPSLIAKDDLKLPLDGQTEKLTLNLDEGSWISLDVAAGDGSLVFELLGDIYRLPIEGGEAVALTQGMAFDSQPKLSPDGSKIAFISDRDGTINLWVMDSDGSNAKKLSSGRQNRLISPTWTPDGKAVVVSKLGTDSSFELFYLDGSGSVQLSDDGGKAFEGIGASFTPDGRYMYYSVIRRSPFRSFPNAQIHRFDRSTGDLEQITQGHGGGARPEISPDGRYMAYISRIENTTQMRLRDLVTGADRTLVAEVQHDTQEIGRPPSRDIYPGYSFTSDSQSVLYTFDGKIKRVSVADGSLSDVPFQATAELDVGPDLTSKYGVGQGPVEARIVHNPSRSPDGKKMVMSVLSHLYTSNADGSDVKRLTKSDAWEFQPIYSPDGRWIAYVTWSMDQGGHIWRVRANGRGRPERLTEIPAFYTDIAYSKNGNRIMAMRGNEWQRHQTFSEFGGLAIPLEMVWLPADGGDVQLVGPAKEARHPHVGPDVDRIYSYNGEALISERFDGSDQREHIKVTGPKGNRASRRPAYAEGLKISPDGIHVLAFVNKQLYVMPLETYGGKVPEVNVRGSAIPVERLTDVGADFYGWSADGSHITWAIGSTYYERALESISFGEDEEETGTDEADTDNEGGTEKDSDESSSESDAADIETEAASSDGASDEKKDDAPPSNEPKEPPLEDDEAVTAVKITVSVDRHRPEGSMVLRGGHVIQMAGEGNDDYARVLENADILVTNDRIVAVGASGTLDVPNGAKVIDVSGKYIMPGMIDTHAHWEFRTGDVLEPQNWSLITSLAYGVTTGLDVQTSHKDYFTYRDMVETGQSVGQRALMTGPGIFGNNDFQSYDQAYYYLQRSSKHYRTKNIKAYVSGNRETRQWIVRASKHQGLMPTTEGAQDLKLDMTHAMDGMHGNEHNIPVFPLYDDVIELYAKTQTAYTTTLLVQYNGIGVTNYFFTRERPYDDPKLQRFYPHNRLDVLTKRKSEWAMKEEFNFHHVARDAANIQRAGGLVGMGGHGELQGLGFHWELWAHNMGGMTPVEVLRAATIDGAKIIGVDSDLGSIEAGKVADMVILDQNPLENIRATTAIHRVVKDGFLYNDDDMTQVWPTEKPLGGHWWWHDKK